MNETPRQVAREWAIRRIFADVCDRSMAGTQLHVRLRRDLELTGTKEDEISSRIACELGVSIALIEWSDFRTIGDVVEFVEFETQRRLAEPE